MKASSRRSTRSFLKGFGAKTKRRERAEQCPSVVRSSKRRVLNDMQLETAATLDRDGRIVDLGKLAGRLWPNTGAEVLIGTMFLELFEDDNAFALQRAFEDVRISGFGRAPIFDTPPLENTEVVLVGKYDNSRRLGTIVRAYPSVAHELPPDHLLHKPYEQLFASLVMGFIVTDRRHRIVIVNEVACAMFAPADSPTTLSRTSSDTLFRKIARLTDDHDLFLENFRHASNSNSPRSEFEIDLLDGRRLLAQCVILNADSTWRYWIFRATLGSPDSPEIEFVQSKSSRDNERKSAMLLAAAHEVRGGLHSIVGLIEELENSPEAPTVSHLIQPLAYASRALTTNVQQVLNVAQIEGGAIDIAVGPLNIATVFSEIAAVARGLIQARPVRLDVSIASDCNPWRLGDAARLTQILTNLASNAAKNTTAGTVSILADSRRPGIVQFDISDTGSGMPDSVIGRLTGGAGYRPVQYSENVRGLGLLIARELVVLLDGTLSVSTIAGSGTTITVELPMPESQPDLPESSAIPGSVARKFDRILVVDDAPEALAHAAKFLQAVAHTVDTTTRTDDALDLASAHVYDFVILDGLMSPLDGADLTRELRRLPSFHDVPIMIATADVSPLSTARYLAAGAQAVLAKPFSSGQLITIVGKLAKVPTDLRLEAEADTGFLLRKQQYEREDRSQVHAIFRDRFDVRMSEIRRAFDEQNPQAFASAVHALGSPALTIGATRIGRLCGAIEIISRSVGLTSLNTTTLNRLENVARVEMDSMSNEDRVARIPSINLRDDTPIIVLESADQATASTR